MFTPTRCRNLSADLWLGHTTSDRWYCRGPTAPDVRWAGAVAGRTPSAPWMGRARQIRLTPCVAGPPRRVSVASAPSPEGHPRRPGWTRGGWGRLRHPQRSQPEGPGRRQSRSLRASHPLAGCSSSTSSADGAVCNPRCYSDRKGKWAVRRRLSAHCRPRGKGGGLGYKDLRVQGLQRASRANGETARRASK